MRVNRWLNQSRWAPSLGNSQPWVIKARDNGSVVMLEISIDHEYVKTPSLLDQYGAASVMSLGALAHNIGLCARTEGLQRINLDYSTTGRNYFASRVTLVFQEQLQRIPMDMSGYFKVRHTSRSAFLTDEIDPNALQVGRQILAEYHTRKRETAVKYIEWGDGREDLVAMLAKLESIRWTNSSLRNQTLAEINMMGSRKTVGIPSEVMSHTSSEKLAWLLARSLPATGLMSKLLSPWMGSGLFERNLKNCNRVFFMGVYEDNLEAWFRLGMALQEVWLHYCHHKIGFEPLSTNLIAYNHLRNPKNSLLGASEAKIVERIHHESEQNMGLRFDCPMLGFRVGNLPGDSARMQVPRRELLATPMF